MEPMERQLIHDWIESLLEQSDQQALAHYRPKKNGPKNGPPFTKQQTTQLIALHCLNFPLFLQ